MNFHYSLKLHLTFNQNNLLISIIKKQHADKYLPVKKNYPNITKKKIIENKISTRRAHVPKGNSTEKNNKFVSFSCS